MVALNHVDSAQLELHFLEFPFLSVSILEVGTRDISVRLAGQKWHMGHFPAEDECRPAGTGELIVTAASLDGVGQDPSPDAKTTAWQRLLSRPA